MRMFAILIVATVISALGADARAGEDCRPGAQFDQAVFAADLTAGETFRLQVHERLTFQLSPTRFGWSVQALDPGGHDRALITPPVRMPETNPRNIAGWHFRNADNTGPNQGDVNAPQRRREFVFGPQAVADDPSGRPATRPTVEPQPAEYGRGVLMIEDFTLANLAPGERARLATLKIAGCIAWIRGAEPVREYSGVYRQGFEQSDFYTDDGQGPWWLEAEGEEWDQLMSYLVPRPGRGSHVTVRLTLRGSTGPFDDHGVTSSAHDTRIVVEDILSIEAIPDDVFQATARGMTPD